MKTISSLVLVAAVLALGNAASAASVYFSLEYPSPGQFNVRLRASDGDNFGIAAYAFELAPKPGVVVTSLDHNSPRMLLENAAQTIQGPAGFTLFRSSDNDSLLRVNGSQDTIEPTPFIIRRFGQQPGNITTIENGPDLIVLGGSESPSWAARPIVASGTLTAPAGTEAPLGFAMGTGNLFLANVFAASSGYETIAAQPFVEVPELSSCGLAAIALIVPAVARRRRGSTG